MKPIVVIFEYEACGVTIRGVRDASGHHRLERKRISSKKFKPVMWAGSDPSALDWYNSDDYKSRLPRILKSR